MKYWLVFCLSFVTIQVLGQPIIEWNEKYDSRDRIVFLGPITSQIQTFIKSGESYIQDRPVLLWKDAQSHGTLNEISLKNSKNKVYEARGNGQFVYIFRKRGIASQGIVQLTADQFDENGKKIKDGVLVSQIKMNNYGDAGEFVIEPISNSPRWVCFSPTFNDQGKPVGQLVIWDTENGRIDQSYMEYPYPEEDPSWEELETDKNGNVWIISKQEGKENARWLHIYNSLKKAWRHEKLTHQNFQLRDHWIYTLNDSMIWIFGTSSKMEDGQTEKIHCKIVSLLDTAQTLYNIAIDSSLLKRIDPLQPDYNFHQFLPIRVFPLTNQKGAIFVFEKIYTAQILNQTPGLRSIQTNTVIHFDDLVFLCIDQNGWVRWVKKIEKNQTCQPDWIKYASASFFNTTTGIFLAFNENIQKGGSVKEYLLSYNGELRSPFLKEALKKDDVMVPEDSYFSNNHVYLQIRNGDQTKFLVRKLNESSKF